MTDHTSHTHPRATTIPTTSTTSCKTVSDNFTQRLSKDTETPEHKTLNNALVPTNEVLSITWKLSQDPAPSHK